MNDLNKILERNEKAYRKRLAVAIPQYIYPYLYECAKKKCLEKLQGQPYVACCIVNLPYCYRKCASDLSAQSINIILAEYMKENLPPQMLEMIEDVTEVETTFDSHRLSGMVSVKFRDERLTGEFFSALLKPRPSWLISLLNTIGMG